MERWPVRCRRPRASPARHRSAALRDRPLPFGPPSPSAFFGRRPCRPRPVARSLAGLRLGQRDLLGISFLRRRRREEEGINNLIGHEDRGYQDGEKCKSSIHVFSVLRRRSCSESNRWLADGSARPARFAARTLPGGDRRRRNCLLRIVGQLSALAMPTERSPAWQKCAPLPRRKHPLCGGLAGHLAKGLRDNCPAYRPSRSRSPRKLSSSGVS